MRLWAALARRWANEANELFIRCHNDYKNSERFSRLVTEAQQIQMCAMPDRIGAERLLDVTV